MKRVIIAMFTVLLGLSSAISCIKDDAINYNLTSMCDIDGVTLTTDQGITLRAVQNRSGEDWTGEKRGFFCYDVMSKIADDEYEIRVNSFARAVSKKCVASSEVREEDHVGTDPISMDWGWWSGKYLNVQASISYVADSETQHYINLVMDDARSNADTLFFNLAHDGAGEVFGATGVSANDVAFGSCYFSFDIDEFLPSGKDEIVIGVKFPWYITVAGGTMFSSETADKEEFCKIALGK